MPFFNHRYTGMPCFVIVLWSIKPKETEEGIIWHSSISLAYYFGQILRLGIGFINWHLLWDGLLRIFEIWQLNTSPSRGYTNCVFFYYDYQRVFWRWTYSALQDFWLTDINYGFLEWSGGILIMSTHKPPPACLFDWKVVMWVFQTAINISLTI